MPSVGHFDAMLMGVGRDPVSEEKLEAVIETIAIKMGEMDDRVLVVENDYVTSKNVGEKFRSSNPKFYDKNKVDYDTLPFGDHLMWDFATGETHAPPVPNPMWMFVEMIKTHDFQGPNNHNALQRAWGYSRGFHATRSRFQGKWSEWVVMQAVPPAGGFPDIPEEPTEP